MHAPGRVGWMGGGQPPQGMGGRAGERWEGGMRALAHGLLPFDTAPQLEATGSLSIWDSSLPIVPQSHVSLGAFVPHVSHSNQWPRGRRKQDRRGEGGEAPRDSTTRGLLFSAHWTHRPDCGSETPAPRGFSTRLALFSVRGHNFPAQG